MHCLPLLLPCIPSYSVILLPSNTPPLISNPSDFHPHPFSPLPIFLQTTQCPFCFRYSLPPLLTPLILLLKSLSLNSLLTFLSIPTFLVQFLVVSYLLLQSLLSLYLQLTPPHPSSISIPLHSCPCLLYHISLTKLSNVSLRSFYPEANDTFLCFLFSFTLSFVEGVLLYPLKIFFLATMSSKRRLNVSTPTYPTAFLSLPSLLSSSQTLALKKLKSKYTFKCNLASFLPFLSR